MKTYKDVDDYIKKADKDKQDVLLELRHIVTENFKNLTEEISYGMPAYKYKEKPFLYFAAMKNHLGFYPTPGPILFLHEDLKEFSTSKGCVRLGYNKTLPKNLILKLLKQRTKEIDSESR